MEPRFGHDFSTVRVHADRQAAESARSVNALAYTVGSEIAFGPGRYAPESSAGRQLLAHELTHVVQQRAGVHLKDGIGQAGDAYEMQADAIAASMSPENLKQSRSESATNGWLDDAFREPMEPQPSGGKAIQFQQDDLAKPAEGSRSLDPTSNPALGAMEQAKVRAGQEINREPDVGVTGGLNTKARTLTVTDRVTKKSKTVQAFTGGHVQPHDCSIISPGLGAQAPAPFGTYDIVDNPNPKMGHEEWYGLFKHDARTDDYFDDQDKERSGVRLHLGMLSHGCVTVVKCQPDASAKWNEIHEMINDTKKEKLKFVQGPHWWNREGETTKYGTITIY
jgi:hypothetical protein